MNTTATGIPIQRSFGLSQFLIVLVESVSSNTSIDRYKEVRPRGQGQ